MVSLVVNLKIKAMRSLLVLFVVFFTSVLSAQNYVKNYSLNGIVAQSQDYYLQKILNNYVGVYYTSAPNDTYSGKEVNPGSDVQLDEQLNKYIKSNAETAYHPCGTLKMGVDKMAVVDENLKIHGLQNIRVVDASVMPEIPSANLNAPTLMIAEKASDIINNSA